MSTASARRSCFALGSLAFAAACFAQEPAQPVQREPGVSIRIYETGRHMQRLRPLVPGQTPNESRIIPLLDLQGRRGDFNAFSEDFILIADGFIEAPSDGEYAFELTSDDGSALWINGVKVVDNDNEHGTESRRGSAKLGRGLQPFEVRFFQSVGQRDLWLKWKPPGAAEFELVPAAALSCQKGEVRVTSPGPKQIILPLERGRPGDARPLEGVHPSYDLARVRPSWFKPRVGGIDWMPDGRMALCTWDPEGSVYLLKGVQGADPEAVEVKKIAAGLAEPLGLCVVDGRIFVLQKQELTELVDHNGDDLIDEYRAICSGWNVTANFHEFAFGLIHRDGYFYANLAIAINPGGRSTQPQIAQRGGVLRISGDGSFAIVASGLRTPNGIGFGVDDEIFITDNQGDWVPVSKVVRLKEGAFYGSQAVLGEKARGLPVMQPLAWLPQGEIGNSPGNVVPMRDGPYRGQMLYCDVTHGGVKRIFAEKVGEEYQGCAFRFTQGLEAGTNRISWGPDGAIYCGGIGSTGNWGQEGKEKYGLERIKYNGKPTFEMLAVRAMSNGLEVEFTEPAAAPALREREQYYVEQYRYLPTDEYGGPKLDREQLQVKSASPSTDGRRVFLEIDGMKDGRVEYVRLIGPWRSAVGRTLWSTEAWYTLNQKPSDRRGVVDTTSPAPTHNQLTKAEGAAGWTLLFDGISTRGWRGFHSSALPDGWRVVDGCLARMEPGGDIITMDQFDDFELSLQWKIAPGGNSGVFFHVSEDGRNVWETGPEMQVLDNERHPDGENPSTSAGANYGLHAPPIDASYPAGAFNSARLVVQGNHVEYWLNGQKQVEYELGSPDWRERVAASKFKDLPRYGVLKRGHIALQDHGDRVWYRDIKIRPLHSR